MTNIVDFPNHEKHLDEACVWIARLDRGLTSSEEKALKAWLLAHQENEKALLNMASLWDKMDKLTLLSELFPSQTTYKKPSGHKKSSWILAYAASLVVACSLGISAYLKFHTTQASSFFSVLYQTSVGEQRKIFLEDGSTLVVNTDSQVMVTFTPQYRLLQLKRGEIHIDVAHDKTRPLRVSALDKVVQAVGTAFDVRLVDSKNIKLWVTEGKVLVGANKNPNSTDELAKVQIPVNALSLSKGEKAVFSLNQEKKEQISEGEMNAQLSWQQGNIVFHGETLDQAVTEFNRYTDKVFIIKDPSLNHIRIAGIFKIGDTTSLLSTLKNNFNIQYELNQENKIYLTEKNK